ncbi:dipeptidyl peptidase 1-like [Palaemon carinicauda]|uniref:dipeptidyl peptidase 1-like n=1 Tax=Palaemon carinicauda TaxID=392227 RepID=UPI0035B63862
MLVTLLFLSGLSLASADVPVFCLYEEIRGTWTFFEGERTGNHTLDCGDFQEPVHNQTFTLDYPNTVIDAFGNVGTWTMMVSEGFEVNINGRSYYAYFFYDGEPPETVSHCDRTLPGWARDKTVRNWSCFFGRKDTPVPPRKTSLPRPVPRPSGKENFQNDHKLIERINSAQKSWWAKPYPEFENYTMEQMLHRAGGKRKLNFPGKASPITDEQRSAMENLPLNFDWRDVDGVDYVSPIRDQGACGSCYSFASMALLESRLRVATKNQRKDIFSPQDAMTCTVLGQGCEGGYIFLTGGRHSMEQGVVAEECNPYREQDEPCDTDMTCPRTYVSQYEFVGGYFGATNEANMMQELVANGPIGVAILMSSDLLYYGGGIYYNTGLVTNFDPFEFADHAILCVGYGVDETTGEKYWILKNSWGESWGEQGYFRVKRGVDEQAIESCATTVTVIP